MRDLGVEVADLELRDAGAPRASSLMIDTNSFDAAVAAGVPGRADHERYPPCPARGQEKLELLAREMPERDPRRDRRARDRSCRHRPRRNRAASPSPPESFRIRRRRSQMAGRDQHPQRPRRHGPILPTGVPVRSVLSSPPNDIARSSRTADRSPRRRSHRAHGRPVLHDDPRRHGRRGDQGRAPGQGRLVARHGRRHPSAIRTSATSTATRRASPSTTSRRAGARCSSRSWIASTSSSRTTGRR